MVDTAAHLVDRVLPMVPVRQWVLTLPYPLRYRCAYDRAPTSQVLRAFLVPRLGLVLAARITSLVGGLFALAFIARGIQTEDVLLVLVGVFIVFHAYRSFPRRPATILN